MARQAPGPAAGAAGRVGSAGGPHHGDEPAGGRSAAIRVHMSRLVTSATGPRGLQRHLGDQPPAPPGTPCPPAAHPAAPACAPRVTTDSVSGRPQLGLGGDDPVEPEQVVFQVVQLALVLGGERRTPPPRAPPAAVGHVPGNWPTGPGPWAATSASAGSLILPCSRSTAIAPFSIGRPRRVGQRARRSPCSRSKQVAVRKRASPPTVLGLGALGQGSGRLVLQLGEGGPAHTAHHRFRPSPLSPPCCSRVVQETGRTTRLCRASSVSDSPTIRPARSVDRAPDLTAQRGGRRLPGRSALDLLLGGLGEAAGLGPGPPSRISAMIWGALARRASSRQAAPASWPGPRPAAAGYRSSVSLAWA